MELGERDLEEELNKVAELSLEKIKTMLKDILKPLMEFHKFGIHLDFKLKNLIVSARTEEELPKMEEKKRRKGNKAKEEKAKEEKERVKTFNWEEKVIKLIDFDGSVQYSEGQQKGKVPHNFMHCTRKFAAPELLQNLIDGRTIYDELSNGKEVYVEVTPKMDIWSAGIIILHNFLSDWNKTPEIAILVVNMLSIDPEKRMSVQGVIDYLEGKCKPKGYEQKPKKTEMFGDVSAENLQKLKEKEFVYLALKEVEIEFAKAEKSIQKFLNSLVKRESICEY
ncbi:hypothetical protein niasHT_033860 [Heterodera trifolii]|uniref:Protein kinase domain-containing protein n=1 Tax=Heterodera trifolii TaxID=157864 RepID=A0ABD2I834_9BILA